MEFGRPPRVMVSHVLIVDREPSTRDLLRDALRRDGHAVEIASDRAEALAFDCTFDVVVADIELDILETVKARSPATEVVLLASGNTLDDALASVRLGAFDFVLKPLFIDDVSLTVACAAARRHRHDLTMPLGFIRKNHDLLR